MRASRSALADRSRGVSHAYAGLVVRLRWVIVAGWLAAVGASLWLPRTTPPGADFGALVSDKTPAVVTETRSFEIFGFPLSSRTAIVQRDPGGMSVWALARGILQGIAVDQGSYDTPLLGALPLPNTPYLFPHANEHDTTLLTYVFSAPDLSFASRAREARTYAANHLARPDDAYVGVTGSAPARAEQARLLTASLPLVEAATVAAILAIVGLTFRSVVAPLVAAAAAGVAVVVTLRVVTVAAALLGSAVPQEMQPLVVALLLGVVTDYTIFFLNSMRGKLREGAGRREAACAVTQEVAPIVLVAGLTVALGTAALAVARSGFIQGFGPGMALTVLIGLVAAITFVPALLAVLGPVAFWPWQAADPQGADRGRRPPVIVLALTRRRSAAAVAVPVLALLALATLPLAGLRLSMSFIEALPHDNRVAVASRAAESGFAPGILSPTELLLQGDGVGRKLGALQRLQTELARQPGVAGVVGPASLPAPLSTAPGVLVSRDRGAARILVILDSPPLEATAIHHLTALQQRLPAMLRDAGLGDVSAGVAGDTAIAHWVVSSLESDLVRTAAAALLVNLAMLVVFLRALVAPLYLLACSVLTLAGTLGLTALVFQGLLHEDGLAFYVPIAVAILLLALGSDYNIFAVGHVWDSARRLPLPEALAVAMPQASSAITAAGVALAASFGLLVLVPLRPFFELAFAMSAGILLDVLVVRSLLVPALITLVGTRSGWPWTRLRGAED